MSSILNNVLKTYSWDYLMKIFEWSPIEYVSMISRDREIEYNFASGSPDPSLIPVKEFEKIFQEVIEEYGYRAFLYPGAGGSSELVRNIEKYYLDKIGVSLRSDEEIVIVSGAQHGIKILSQILVEKGDIVIVENPTFWEGVYPIRFHGASLRGVSIDEEGLDTYYLEKILREGLKPRFIYLNPTCHNPTGYVMSIDRRRHLLEIAERYDLYVIEDDPYRPVSKDPPPSLKSIDKSGRVIYIGSMSKIFAPGLRIGFVITNKDLAEKIKILEQHDFSTSTFLQLAMSKALEKNITEALMKRCSEHYDMKRKILLEALERYFPERYTRPVCGFFNLIYVDKDPEIYVDKAIERRLLYVPATRFFVENPMYSIRIGIGLISSEKIFDGIKVLREIFEE